MPLRPSATQAKLGESLGAPDLAQWRRQGRPRVDYAEIRPVRLHCVKCDDATEHLALD